MLASWFLRLSVVYVLVGMIALIGAVGLIYADHPGAEPFAAASSFVVIGGMVLFAIIVFRATRVAT